MELFYCMSLVSRHVLIDDEIFLNVSVVVKFFRVSVQGVESLWGDCRFIPADLGS